MIKLSLNEMTTFRWTFEEDVQHYTAAGLSGIGVWRQKMSDFGEEKSVALLEESDLSVSSLVWAGGFTGSDGRSYKESLTDAHEAIRLAARLRAECLVFYSGSRSGHTQNHARRLFKSALKELLPFAAEFGVTLAIEPMHAGCAGEWTFLTSLDETMGLISELAENRLKLVYDTYHFGQAPDLLDNSELIGQIGLVHLGDARQPPDGEQNRCRLGDGSLQLSEIVAKLSRAGYRGWYEVELMGEDLESIEYEELLVHSKQIFESWQHPAGQTG